MYFRFQDPVFALLVLLLLAAIWLKQRWGMHATLIISSNWTINQVLRRSYSRTRRTLAVLRILALLLIIIALMRPQTGRKWTEMIASGVDIMLAVDLSGSMLAHDFEIGGKLVSRIEVVKTVIDEFIEKRPNDRIGLIIFAEEPFLVSPITHNHDWLRSNLERLEIGVIGPNATAIGSAIGMSINRLRRIESDSHILIMLTDGENNAGVLHPIAAAEAAKSFGIKIYTVGVGRSESVMMPRQRGNVIVRNADGNPVMDWMHFDINENELRVIARISDGRFFRATNTEGLQSIYHEIDKLEEREVAYIRHDEVTELMFLPMLLAAILLLLEVILARTALHKLP